LLGSLALGVVPASQSVATEIAGRFDANETLFVIIGRERPNDVAVLEAMFRLHSDDFDAPTVRYIHPDQLDTAPNEQLICRIDSGSNSNAEAVPVRQCILELHQDELLALADPVLDGLVSLSVASRCLNPVWTILLAHDKRMLAVLRNLSAHELPDNEARRFLKEHIVPTTHLASVQALEQLVVTQRGLLDTTLVAKPCLLGKGEGILFEKDFETPALFVQAVSDAANVMLRGAGPGAVFPYIVQGFVRQERFNVLRPPEDDPSFDPVAWNVVATLLCLDSQFLGPGIFRSSSKDIVALCNGGMMLVPALALPCVQPEQRFVAGKIATCKAAEVRGTLMRDGLALVCLDKAAADRHEFEGFVRDGLGALVHQHSADVGGVWTIKPRAGGVARSHTADEFLPHTDASYEPDPPRFFSLSMVRADHGSGGLLGVASVADAVAQISEADFDILRNTVVKWNRPQEFQKDMMPTTAAPVLMSRNRARVRGDIIDTSHLCESASDAFWAAYHRFFAVLDQMCHASARLLPERAVILVDNQRFVHARSRIKDTNRCLLRIRFDFPQRPELESLLEAAVAKGTDNSSKSLLSWPIQTKSDYLAAVSYDFTSRYHNQGGLYWSPSGGSTSGNKGAEVCAIPSSNVENKAMRAELIDLLCGVGAVPRSGCKCVAVNMFASGGLYRSLEIFGEVFIGIDATHLPLGAERSDEEALRTISHFGANVVCGWGSRILQVCQAAKAHGKTAALASISTVIHGGEKLSARNRQFISAVCGGGVVFYGCFGSAEAGVFGCSLGIREGGDKSALGAIANSSEVQDETYALLSEGIHAEIVDDAGKVLSANEWGNIVVTNLHRRSVQPLVRFNMGDIGRLVDIPGHEQALQVRGRANTAMSFRLSAKDNFLYWKDVEEKVLKPLATIATADEALCLAQIIFSSEVTVPSAPWGATNRDGNENMLAAGQKRQKVEGELVMGGVSNIVEVATLAVFTTLPSSSSLDEATRQCSVEFARMLKSCKTHVKVLDEMSDLVRSPRSQKLLLWVDRRDE
jgi:phenylacetate-coenzyme A ligase PaaK-like adenylate-forming protein